MKKTALLSLILLLLLGACGNKPEITKVQIDSVPATTKKDLLFSVTDFKNYKKVEVFNSTDQNQAAFTYVLYHKGQTKPKIDFKAQFVATPVDRAAVLSSLYIGCLDKLNLLDKVIAVDNKNYICNEYIRKKIDTKEVKEISKTAELDIEQTLLLNPELIITYGSGNAEKDLNKKITEAGIPIAISSDYLETSPISRAKWLKFVALFFEKEKLADSLLKRTERNYDSLKLMATLTPLKPKVLTEIKQSDAWFVPGGKSFMAKMLNDAGADYIWKDNDKSGSLALSYEEVFVKAGGAEFWLQLSGWTQLNDCIKQDARNENFKAYQLKQLYNNNAIMNKEGGNAYWESGLISPDEVLKDLIKIFHPELLPAHQLKYYKKLN